MTDNKVYPFPSYPSKGDENRNESQEEVISGTVDDYYDEDEYFNYRSYPGSYESEYGD